MKLIAISSLPISLAQAQGLYPRAQGQDVGVEMKRRAGGAGGVGGRGRRPVRLPNPNFPQQVISDSECGKLTNSRTAHAHGGWMRRCEDAIHLRCVHCPVVPSSMTMAYTIHIPARSSVRLSQSNFRWRILRLMTVFRDRRRASVRVRTSD